MGKLEYPQDPIAWGRFHNGTENPERGKRQENLRVWRQTNDPTQRATCINDGKRKRGAMKGVKKTVIGNCCSENFENPFPTQWIPLANKWGGLEYQGSELAFMDGSSYRRFGNSDVGSGRGGPWTIGSAQKQGPMAGDRFSVKVVEMYACNHNGDGEDDDDMSMED